MICVKMAQEHPASETSKSRIWGKSSMAQWCFVKCSLWRFLLGPCFCQPSVNGLWIFMVLTVRLSSAPFSALYLGTLSLHSRCTICQAFWSSESLNIKKQKDYLSWVCRFPCAPDWQRATLRQKMLLQLPLVLTLAHSYLISQPTLTPWTFLRPINQL